MAPKTGLRKTQLTLDAFRKDAPASNLRSKSARRTACSPNPVLAPPAPLPKPTAPVTFRSSTNLARSVSLPRPTAPQPPPHSSPDDAAWDLARNIYDAGATDLVDPPANREPYGDENCPTPRPSPQSNLRSRHVESDLRSADGNGCIADDDDDFQNNPRQSAPPSRTRRRRSTLAASPLRDDRPSMTRRSAKKRKARVSLLQTPTLSLSEERYSDCNAIPTPRRRLDAREDQSQVPLRATALFEGNHSELSSDTDHDDRPIRLSSLRLEERPSQLPSPLKSRSQVINLCCSPRAPVPSIPVGFDTPPAPARSSPVLHDGLHIGAHIPGKEAALGSPMPKIPSKPQVHQKYCSRASTTRKRGRRLISLFNDDSLGLDGRDVDGRDDGHPEIGACPVSTSKDRPGSSKRVTPDPPTHRRILRSAANNCLLPCSDPSDVENNCKSAPFTTPKPSVLKRRRVVYSSSSDDGCDSPPRAPIIPLTTDGFRTPDHKRPLPEALRPRTPQNEYVADGDVEVVGNTAEIPEQATSSYDDKDGCNNKSPSKRLTRRSGRLRSRAKSELLNLSQSESPSPPSTRKKGRFSKLETRADSDDELASGGAGVGVHSTRVNFNIEATDNGAKGDAQASGFKCKEWFFERDIGQFSSSSSDVPDFKRTPIGAQRRRNARNGVNIGLQSAEPAAVERPIVTEFSDDGNEFQKVSGVESVGNTPTQSPPRPEISSVEIADPDVVVVDAVGTEDANRGVMDLIDFDDTADFEEPHNRASQAIQSVGSAEDVMEVDDDEQHGEPEAGPPPFNLHALCENNEDLIAMMERLGEDHVLELISKAQGEGRKIIGGEELGLDQTFNTDVFDKYSRTIVATEIRKDRSGTLNITERALKGEYQFNYRGRNTSASASSGRRGGRGRGRGRGYPYRKRKSRGGRRR